MRASIMVLALSLAAPAVARAEPELVEFLEQRVPEELAAHGTVLSRTGVKLEVEAVGQKLLISLVDTTGHTVASTKLDSVPDDREAAVTLVVNAATKLVAQLGNAGPAAEAPRSPPADAEYKFRQEAIYFGDEVAIISSGHSTVTATFTVPYQGEIRRPLYGARFFEAVGRDDLAASFNRRRNSKIGLLVAGGAAEIAGATLLLVKGLKFYDHALCIGVADVAQCQADDAAKAKAFDDAKRPYIYTGFTLMGVGLIAVMIPLFYSTSPVELDEIYDLAAQHNARLRKKYGLTSLRALHFEPLALRDGGGMMVGGRF